MLLMAQPEVTPSPGWQMLGLASHGAKGPRKPVVRDAWMMSWSRFCLQRVANTSHFSPSKPLANQRINMASNKGIKPGFFLRPPGGGGGV
jgi:hypothetical protein